MVNLDVNTQNSSPKQTFLSDTAGCRVFVDRYDSGRVYDGTTSVTGKRQVGLLDPNDGNVNLVPELDPIESGAVRTSQEELLQAWTGDGMFRLRDMNPLARELQIGTAAGKIRDTQPDTPVTGALAAGSTQTKLVLEAGDAADFVTHKGKCIMISANDDGSPPIRAYISDVVYVAADPGPPEVIAVDEIHLAFPLDETPPSTGTVTLLQGFTQEVGGNYMQNREFIVSQDLGKGGRHVTVIWNTTPTGGAQISLANGTQATEVSFKVQGHVRTVDSIPQQVPLTTFGTYGRLVFA